MEKTEIKQLGAEGAMQYLTGAVTGALAVIIYAWGTKPLQPPIGHWEALGAAAAFFVVFGGLSWWLIDRMHFATRRDAEANLREDVKKLDELKLALNASELEVKRWTAACSHFESDRETWRTERRDLRDQIRQLQEKLAQKGPPT